MKPRNQNSSGNHAPSDASNLVPQGAHTARIILVAFIGALVKTFQGKEQSKDTILVTFELTDEERDYQGEKYKMVITKEYGFNYAPKGFFRRDIESILARPLSDDEVNYDSEKLFNPSTLLDIPVMITVTHETWESKGKSGINVEVQAVSALPEKMKALIAPAQRKLVNFDISKFTVLSELKADETFKQLNKFIKGKIEQTTDWKALVEMSNDDTQSQPTTTTEQTNTTNVNFNQNSISENENLPDDLPF